MNHYGVLGEMGFNAIKLRSNGNASSSLLWRLKCNPAWWFRWSLKAVAQIVAFATLITYQTLLLPLLLLFLIAFLLWFILMKHSSVVIELIETNSHLTSFIQLYMKPIQMQTKHTSLFRKSKRERNLSPSSFSPNEVIWFFSWLKKSQFQMKNNVTTCHKSKVSAATAVGKTAQSRSSQYAKY